MLFLLPREALDAASAPLFTRYLSAVAPELGRRFEEACLRHSPQSVNDLRGATVTLVERLKADGLPPERVVIAIKTALVRYGGYPHAPSYNDHLQTAPDDPRALAYRCVFRWSIDAYFGTSDAITCCPSA